MCMICLYIYITFMLLTYICRDTTSISVGLIGHDT